VAFAADIIALAVAEIGAIAQRRVALMVDPTLSHDLPPFLTKAPGLNSGFMIAEVTTAALMSENKHLAMPCSTDSTPTSANQEDHVSMAAHGSRRLSPMVRNLERILGIEALCAAQGIEFRAPLETSAPLAAVVARLRADVPALGEDRFMAPDLEAAARRFSPADLRDLQVWQKLAWVDPYYLDRDPRIRALVAKGRAFDEGDKATLRAVELEILNAVIPAYRARAAAGQIEISASPFYHPILPLLCDTDV
jgi:hypothetical protein